MFYIYITYLASVGQHLAHVVQLILTDQSINVVVHSFVEVCYLEQLDAT